VTALLVVGGCVLLTLRPALLHAGPPTTIVIVLFVGLLVTSLHARLPAFAASGGHSPRVAGGTSSRGWLLVAGIAVFVVGRALAGGHAPQPLTMRVLALNSLAAIGEEAFFRRLVFGALESGGAALAVVGSAVLFAAVHLTLYGAWVLPLDLAAGLVLGWQRWASGSWSVPAATHVVANVLVVI
jgi:membrane protease YdiL (CAAX protease family)